MHPVSEGDMAAAVHYQLVFSVVKDCSDDLSHVPLGGSDCSLVLDPDSVTNAKG